ncbi:MAG: hypothetical protein IPH51_11135 [Rubrivivax sp.]|nr:hypothetical protein [Rubrivivax sp.]
MTDSAKTEVWLRSVLRTPRSASMKLSCSSARVSCARPKRSRCDATTSVLDTSRSIVPPSSQRRLRSAGWVLISPVQACSTRPSVNLLVDDTARPKTRR